MEKYNDLMREIHSDKVRIKDIVVTSILFGLTLNLISDFLSSLLESINNPWHLIYRSALAIGSITITLYLLNSIANRELESESRLFGNGAFFVKIDSTTGLPIDNPEDFYQNLTSQFYNIHPEQTEFIQGVIANVPRNDNHFVEDLDYFMPLTSYLSLKMISNVTEKLARRVESKEHDLGDTLKNDLANLLRGTKLH
jgi:hypothetical protein